MINPSVSPQFTKTVRRAAALLLAALLMAACQPAAASTPEPPTLVPTTAPTIAATTAPTNTPTEEPTAAPTATPAATATPAFDEPTLSVANHPALGDILVGEGGMTLYIFTLDEPGKSNCNDECLDFWPPLLTQGNPRLGPGVDPTLVGSATLADGARIVTYNQMPLYYWHLDAQPGDASGEGVDDVWFVVSPSGAAINPPALSQPTSAPAEDKDKDDGDDYDSGY